MILTLAKVNNSNTHKNSSQVDILKIEGTPLHSSPPSVDWKEHFNKLQITIAQNF